MSSATGLIWSIRMPFTRRGLLLWHTPRYAKRNNCTTPADFLREMWVAPLFAVGGVSPANLADYLLAGCTGAGLGSELYRPGQSAETTATHAAAFMAAYRAFQR